MSLNGTYPFFQHQHYIISRFMSLLTQNEFNIFIIIKTNSIAKAHFPNLTSSHLSNVLLKSRFILYDATRRQTSSRPFRAYNSALLPFFVSVMQLGFMTNDTILTIIAITSITFFVCHLFVHAFGTGLTGPGLSYSI